MSGRVAGSALRGSSSVLRCTKTSSVRRPKTEANTLPVWCSMACQRQRGLPVFPTNDPYPSHLLLLASPRMLSVSGHLSRVQRAQQSGVHRLQRRGFLLEFTQHGIGTDM